MQTFETQDITSSNASLDNFDRSITESGELPAMPSTVNLDDLFEEMPELAPLDEDIFRELTLQLDLSPLTDPRETPALPTIQLPSTQDLRSKFGKNGALANKHDTRLHPLQGPLGLGTRKLPTPSACVNPLVLQESGTRAACPKSLILPELGPPPVGREYRMLPLPTMSFDKGLPPSVPPKSDYDMLQLPPLLLGLNGKPLPVPRKSGYDMLQLPPLLPKLTGKPLPLPPKGNFNSPTQGAVRSTSSLRPHITRYPYQQQAARYPHKPLRPILVHDQVEDLALDPEERETAIIPFAQAGHHASVPVETFSSPQTTVVANSDAVYMNSSLSQSPAGSNPHPYRCHCQCHQTKFSDSSIADSAENRRRLAEQRAKEWAYKASVKVGGITRWKKGDTARLTARANAGKSGYVPRSKKPQNPKAPQPVTIVIPYTKAAQK
jgi:hypothetical protein